MNLSISLLLISFVGGLAVGAFYFGGLWWTVRRLAVTQKPALLMTGSFVIRTLISLFLFYIFAGGAWYRVLLCLFGFLVARYLITRRMNAMLAYESVKGSH